MPLLEVADSSDVTASEIAPTNKVERKSTDFQSFVNTAKNIWGNGYLAIPAVFSKTGWLGGIILFGSIGCLNTYTCVQNVLVAEQHPQLHSYSQVAKAVFGSPGRWFVDIAIWVAQLSFGIAYIYFIAQQMDAAVCHYTGGVDNDGFCSRSDVHVAILTVPALLISWSRTYTFLSYFSAFGLSCALLGMLLMMGFVGAEFKARGNYDFSLDEGTDLVGRPELKVFDVAQFFGNIGVAIFCFEGNSVVTNIRAETINQDKYPRIVICAIFSVIVIQLVYGTLAYATYGEDCRSIFTLNLLPIDNFVVAIYALISINCFISFPLQILVVFDMTEQHSFFQTGSRLRLKQIVMRSILVLMISGVASAIPDFTIFADIVGAVGMGSIAFIFPPLLYNKQFANEISPLQKYGNWAIVAFGFIGATLSVGTSIKAIVDGDFH